jgi:hypothetical protein
MDDAIEERLVRIEAMTTQLRVTLTRDQEQEAGQVAWLLSREARDLNHVLEDAQENAELEKQGLGWIKAGAKARVKSGKEVEIMNVFAYTRKAVVCFDTYARRTVPIDQLEPVEPATTPER